jgi:uncharacterized oligopeptide transporter (OPT) family protein
VISLGAIAAAAYSLLASLRVISNSLQMGMYLPVSLTLTIPIGAFVGRGYDIWARRAGGDVERKRRLGILMAIGLIVDESPYGVAFAAVVAATGDDAPLAVVATGSSTPRSGWAPFSSSP